MKTWSLKANKSHQQWNNCFQVASLTPLTASLSNITIASTFTVRENKTGKTYFISVSMAPNSRASKKAKSSLRKTGLKVKKNGTAQQTSKSLISEFLRILYEDLANSAGTRPVMHLTEIQSLLRLARTTRLLRPLPRTRRTRYYNELQALKPTDAALGKVVADAVQDVQKTSDVLATRLDECVVALGYPVLCICLHSAVFRTALNANDGSKRLNWQQILVEIAKRASSLELFAKTRSLNYGRCISATDLHFAALLTHANKALSIVNVDNTPAVSVGIQPREKVERHRIDDSVLNPHLWVLPLDENASATCPQLSCKNNKKLRTDYPSSNTDQIFSRPYEDIRGNVVLKSYEWPRKDYWPEPHPCYAGLGEWPCFGCKEIRDLVSRAKRSERAEPHLRCDCSLEDLGSYKCTPLVELYFKALTGVSVRALQNISKGIILDPYIGEIMPAHKKGNKAVVPCRYGGDSGAAYRLKVGVCGRHAKIRSRKAARPSISTSPSSSPSPSPPRKKTKKGRSDEDTVHAEDIAELEANEYTEFVIDSAFRANWTRYINHNCDPNTKFVWMNVGMRSVIVVQALRDIQFSEKIIAYYSDDYFTGQNFACKCGIKTCLN